MQILRQTSLKGLEKARSLGRDEVLKVLEKKNLVGRGGAGFPTAKKWKISIDTEADEKFLICNADEGEPGTFKDKFILKNNAETLIEGMIIAAETIGAKQCFIYLRGEYENIQPHIETKIKDVLAKSESNISIEVVRGAGAYVCGEETAILQSIMGFRGNSMMKPPFPPVEGLWGKPTVVNNVETLTNVPLAILYDDWDQDLRLFSVSGNISHPGVYEFPLGVKMSTILDTAKPKGNLKAMSFGCFGGIMPIEPEKRITPEAIMEMGCHHGAYSIVLINDTHNIVDISYSIAKFYTYESCGKCTPCREGTIRMLNLIKKIRSGEATQEDLDTLDEFAHHVNETSLCGLGQTSGNHIISGIRNFPEDYKRWLE